MVGYSERGIEEGDGGLSRTELKGDHPSIQQGRSIFCHQAFGLRKQTQNLFWCLHFSFLVSVTKCNLQKESCLFLCLFVLVHSRRAQLLWGRTQLWKGGSRSHCNHHPEGDKHWFVVTLSLVLNLRPPPPPPPPPPVEHTQEGLLISVNLIQNLLLRHNQKLIPK